MKNIFKNFWNLLFPKKFRCIFCGEEIFDDNKYCTCEKCKKSLPYNNGKVCLHCGIQETSLASYCIKCKGKKFYYIMARAPFNYEGKIAGAIQHAKYNNAKYLFEPLAYYLVDEYNFQKFNVDIVSYVPLHSNRQKQRGFNQSEELAKVVAKELSLPINNVLYRTKDTPTQTKLTFSERQSNLENAFKIADKKLIKNKDILLIDDVFTTGATANNCARALMLAGAKGVYLLTIAHVNFFNNEKNT